MACTGTTNKGMAQWIEDPTTVAAGGLLDSGGAMDRSATMAMAIVEIEIRIEGHSGKLQGYGSDPERQEG